MFRTKLENIGESIVDWAINLASQNIQQRPQITALNSPIEDEHHRTRVEHPSIHVEDLRLDSPSQVPAVPRINQAGPSEPVYPSIRGPPVPRPVNPIARQHSTSSEEANYLRTEAVQLHCHYPESVYVAEHLPTRRPRELQAFKEHCRLQYDQHQISLDVHHPLSHIREFTSSILNFQNYLWRSKTTVTYFGIYEEYHWIRRQVRRNQPDKAILQPAYKIHYQWNEDGWTVTRLPRH